ncbi:MAG: hypothetical protein P4L46_26280 [Fimbriimonas sp.]|nr:hypothetical protein [Fimbriimonas sp.]
MRRIFCILGLIAFASAAFGQIDVGRALFVQTSYGTSNYSTSGTAYSLGNGPSYSAPTNILGIKMYDKDNGTHGGTWSLKAKMTAGGQETGVTLNFVPGTSYYGATFTNSNPVLTTGGGSVQFCTGAAVASNTLQQIATLGFTVTVPSDATPGGPFTGHVEVDLYDSQNGNNPMSSTTFYYTYNVVKPNQVVVSPSSVSSFATGYGTGIMTFTADTGALTDSILAYTSSASTWTLNAMVSAPTGNESSVVVNQTSTGSGAPYYSTVVGSTPIQIGGTGLGTPIANGATTQSGQSGPAAILTSGLVITVPNTTTPGPYTGTITFTLTANGTPYTTTASYTYTVPTYLNISFDQSLAISVSSPGIPTAPSSTPNNYTTLSATGNVGYHLTASISSLTYNNTYTIPTSQLWLFLASSPTTIQNYYLSPGGANSGAVLTLNSLTGNSTAYLGTMVQTTVSQPPGSYTGTITVTVIANP